MPKCASVSTSVSAVRWSVFFVSEATARARCGGRERSGSTYSPSTGGESKSVVCVSSSGSPQERRRLGQALRDDVRVVVLDVDRRQVAWLGARAAGRSATLLLKATFSGRATARRTAWPGAAQEGAVGGAREQQPAREQRRRADEQRAGLAEQLREPAAEDVADEAAVVRAERRSAGRASPPTSPVRNGRTSSRLLRKTIRPPTPTSAAGAT